MLFRVTGIFHATTAHCHYRAAIKIHITHFTRIFNDHFYKRIKELWAAETQKYSIVFGTNINLFRSNSSINQFDNMTGYHR